MYWLTPNSWEKGEGEEEDNLENNITYAYMNVYIILSSVLKVGTCYTDKIYRYTNIKG